MVYSSIFPGFIPYEQNGMVYASNQVGFRPQLKKVSNVQVKVTLKSPRDWIRIHSPVLLTEDSATRPQ